ncbi:MAG: type II toxin-antitoxin system RelE/ParE family toxin [Alphaproteobacteria bacterium]|nr:type II toxin-antitoxin system RelE/ParE family toxin [Alphaproteobacteria bacterium]
MTRRFLNSLTEDLYLGYIRKGMPADIARVARRKLQQVVRAALLQDLAVPPNNRLEALKGSRKGMYSIRVNERWRICFIWKETGAENIEFIDYH